VGHTLLEHRPMWSAPCWDHWTRRWTDHKSLMHGHCDARPTLTILAIKHHRSLDRIILLPEAHWCKQLAQGCYLVVVRPGVELLTFRLRIKL